MSIFDYIVTSDPDEVVKCPVCENQPEIGPCMMKGDKILEWEICCDQFGHFLSICGETREETVEKWNKAFGKVGPCVCSG